MYLVGWLFIDVVSYVFSWLVD